ncbi:lysozyme [Lysobacter enzymogenes]|uniref:lysozyme n=1 Tax=Lysobacter enzymogenes TaxID=69 RepID=UPI00384E1D84
MLRLSAPQRAALIDFVFNLGKADFAGSTLLARLNSGDYAAVPGQLLRWNKATVAGKRVVLDGLTTRRYAEVRLWST